MIITLLSIVLILASLLLMVLVLLHRGKGGGLSSMFGGSLYSSLSGSSVVERNLDRLTVVKWACCPSWTSAWSCSTRRADRRFHSSIELPSDIELEESEQWQVAARSAAAG